MLRPASLVRLIFSSGLAAHVLVGSAIAQQAIPRAPGASTPLIFAPSGINAQDIPGISRPPTTVPSSVPDPDRALGFPYTSPCALSGVRNSDIEALRGAVLDLLASNAAAKNDFLKSEKGVPGTCDRKRAEFYLRVLGRIKSPG